MEVKKPSILFMGTPYFAARALGELLVTGFSVIGVVTRPDTARGRSGSKQPSEVKIEADKHGIPVFQPENKAELYEIVRKVQPELIVVAAFGMIIPLEALEIPKYGTINIHGSLLPKYRGASPIAEAILNGDKETGVTIMEVAEAMDAGNVISQYKLPIFSPVIPSECTEPRNPLGGITEGSLQQGRDDNRDFDTTESLTEKMADLGARAIVETIPKWISGEIKSTPQNNAEATYCHKISKADGEIDWNESAESIERKIRAYNPWPSAYFFLDGKRIKVLHASCHCEESDHRRTTRQSAPGAFAAFDNRLFVTTGSGSLEILELQPEGKKPMPAKDFINGNKL